MKSAQDYVSEICSSAFATHAKAKSPGWALHQIVCPTCNHHWNGVGFEHCPCCKSLLPESERKRVAHFPGHKSVSELIREAVAEDRRAIAAQIKDVVAPPAGEQLAALILSGGGFNCRIDPAAEERAFWERLLVEAQGTLAEVAIADDLDEADRRKKAKYHYDRIEAAIRARGDSVEAPK